MYVAQAVEWQILAVNCSVLKPPVYMFWPVTKALLLLLLLLLVLPSLPLVFRGLFCFAATDDVTAGVP